MNYDYDLIDIHSHILFGVDKGPDLPEESEEMLRECYNQGVRKIVVTPSRKKGIFDLEVKHINRNFKNLKQIAKSISEDLEVYLGSEIFYTEDILDKIKEGEYPRINKSNYILLEFNKDEKFNKMYLAINKCRTEGYIPIILNSEKYEALNDIQKVKDIIELGCCIQININNILPKKVINEEAKKEKDRVNKMLKENLVDVVGTNMKNIKSSINIKRAHDIIYKKYGYNYAKKLFFINPVNIINNNIIG